MPVEAIRAWARAIDHPAADRLVDALEEAERRGARRTAQDDKAWRNELLVSLQR